MAPALTLEPVVRVSDGAARGLLIAAAALAVVFLLMSCFFAPKLTDAFADSSLRAPTLTAAFPARCVFLVVYALLMVAVVASVIIAAVIYKSDGSNSAVVLLAVVAPLTCTLLALLCCFAARRVYGDNPRPAVGTSKGAARESPPVSSI